MKNTVLFASLLLAASTTACMRNNTGSSIEDLDSAPAAADSQEAVSDEGDVMIADVDGAEVTPAGATLTATSAATTIATNIAASWPGACAVATASGATVTITYNDCTGPRGLVHVTGELDLTITVTGAAIGVHATATDFKVNGATLDFDADGTYTASGAQRQLVVTAQGSGTGSRGNAIDHDGNYTLQWDTSDDCRSIDGQWSTELSTPVASATRANTVDLARCGAACPTGSLTHKYLGGATLTLEYNGSATATWSTSGGLSGTIALLCTP